MVILDDINQDRIIDTDGYCTKLQRSSRNPPVSRSCRYILIHSQAQYLPLMQQKEAGLYPGVAYYITLWYPRHRAQYRQALFFSAASIAGAFSGLLAYGIAVRLTSSEIEFSSLY